MTTGNRPADGGHLIIEAEDYENFLRKEPNAAAYTIIYFCGFLVSLKSVGVSASFCLSGAPFSL